MYKKRSFRYLAVFLIALLLCGCYNLLATEPTTSSVNSRFASYDDTALQYSPAVKEYHAASNLNNVINNNQFKFSSPARQLLIQNAFVVVPGKSAEFYEIYDSEDQIPNFITTDSMLHTYHLQFDYLLKVAEESHLNPDLKSLNSAMLAASQEQYHALQNTSWGNAARRNLAYFALANHLSDLGSKIPDEVKKEVDQELTLIAKHDEVRSPSPIMNIGNTGSPRELLYEDYTQYVPRGHYTESPALEKYFKTMMWYGRMTFRVKNADETKSAILMTTALKDNLPLWEKIYDTSNFFVGDSDDIDYYQYRELMTAVYGPNPDVKALPDEAHFTALIKKAAALKPPAIVSIPIMDKTLQPDTDKEILGFRFMGQRYNLDAEIMQKLVYDNVEANPEGERRMLPSALDVPAAMGSEEAYRILEAGGQTAYVNYPENMTKLREHINSLPDNTWQQNLYWGWLYNLQTLIAKKGAGYPSFMTNQAWVRKNLNTYLGSWTELKHDTILYTKQAYVMCGCAPQQISECGYVEPNPECYARLASLAKMTRVGLQKRGYLGNTDRESLQLLEKTCETLKAISLKELSNKALTEDEYGFIRTFRQPLWQIWRSSMKDQEKNGRGTVSEPEDYAAALAADVATSPEIGKVLEEATGGVSDIYVVVPINGKLQIARGAVFSYYEFPWNAANRLSDQDWRKMLSSGSALSRPGWTGSFTSD